MQGRKGRGSPHPASPPSTFPLVFILDGQLPLVLLPGFLLQVEQDSLLLFSRPVHEVIPDLTTQATRPHCRGLQGAAGSAQPPSEPPPHPPIPRQSRNSSSERGTNGAGLRHCPSQHGDRPWQTQAAAMMTFLPVSPAPDRPLQIVTTALGGGADLTLGANRQRWFFNGYWSPSADGRAHACNPVSNPGLHQAS